MGWVGAAHQYSGHYTHGSSLPGQGTPLKASLHRGAQPRCGCADWALPWSVLSSHCPLNRVQIPQEVNVTDILGHALVFLLQLSDEL